MKTALAYLVVAILAIGIGIGTAYIYRQNEAATTDEQFFDNQWDVSDSSALTPKGIVISPSFDFGVIDPAKTYQHEFLVESSGTLDLEIWFDEEDISPLSLDLTKERVNVSIRSTFPLTVKFEGKDISKNFDSEIKIQTNQRDGIPLILKVSGKLPQE